MPKVTSLGHMGFYVRDIERSVAFYRDILGLTVSDRSPRGAVFMTSQDRSVEHHELYLAPGRNDDGKVNVLQQISFRCPTLKDVKDFHQLFVDKNVPISRVVPPLRAEALAFSDASTTVAQYAFPPDGMTFTVTLPFGLRQCPSRPLAEAARGRAAAATKVIARTRIRCMSRP